MATSNEGGDMTTSDAQSETTPGASVFSRVLVGVDGSAEAREAARQAAIVAEAPPTLIAAYALAPAIVGGTGPGIPAYYDEDAQREAAEAALEQARSEIDGRSDAKIVRGTSWAELLREIERERMTLVAVGSHGQGRARGIVVGSTTTELVHKAPCSVLVARKAGEGFPESIVVGIDGSSESAAAYAAARELSRRFGARLWPIVAHGGDPVDKRAVATIVDHHHEDSPDEPVRALVAAGAEADLVVVGSRGLHGLKALGSVSERVAHQATCSVLIVREAPSQRTATDVGPAGS
jgi:nucleotide-binding universal stress UspA family protein